LRRRIDDLDSPDAPRQLLEPHGAVDQVAEHRLAGFRIALEEGIDRLAELGVAKCGVARKARLARCEPEPA